MATGRPTDEDRGRHDDQHEPDASAVSHEVEYARVARCCPADPEDYASLVRELVDQGMDKKEAVRTVAKRCGVSKRSVYQAALTI